MVDGNGPGAGSGEEAVDSDEASGFHSFLKNHLHSVLVILGFTLTLDGCASWLGMSIARPGCSDKYTTPW